MMVLPSAEKASFVRSPRLLDQVRDQLRLKHYSYRTEQTYLYWQRRFICFHGKQHPAHLGADKIRDFLTYLAVHDRVAASTQNQALNAIVFLYREVLRQDPGRFDDFARAKVPRKLPVVLSRSEVSAVLCRLEGTPRLTVGLLYGSGLRILEALRLRIKDLDFDHHQIVVRCGKGAKDRVTVLPQRLAEKLRHQMDFAQALHQRDMHKASGSSKCPTPWPENIRAQPGNSAGNTFSPQRIFRPTPGPGGGGAITSGLK
jgi:integrase